MNTRKPIAIVAAMLITAAGLTGIATYSNAAADSAIDAAHASAHVIRTLPTINVTPTREQLRQLRDERDGKTGSASAAAVDARMPYYSFASDQAGA